jgi:hypothetical protein
MDVTTRCAEKPGHQTSLTGCRQAVKIADSNRMDAVSYPWKSYIPKVQQQQWASLERLPPSEAQFVRIDTKLTVVSVLKGFTNLKGVSIGHATQEDLESITQFAVRTRASVERLTERPLEISSTPMSP